MKIFPFSLFFLIHFIYSEQVINLLGAGSSLAGQLYDSLAFAFASELPKYSLSFNSIGSSKGKCRIMGYWQKCTVSTDKEEPLYLDWAGTDAIHNASDYEQYPDLQMYPGIAAAVVVIYNIPGVDDLVITPNTVARIYIGNITHWNDPQIINENLEYGINVTALNLAGAIKPVVRADGSGTTDIFKQACAKYNSEFKYLLESTNDLNEKTGWPGLTPIKGNTNQGVSATVLRTPSSIGYVSFDEAKLSGNKYAGMGKSVLSSDNILRASEQTVQYALLERGFGFGLISSDPNPDHLTANVMGASGTEAWPFVGYTYFSIRLNTLRNLTTGCETRSAMLHWFEWFYRSRTASDIAISQGFSPLPVEGRTFVLGKLREQFKCNSQLVFTNEDDFEVKISAGERKNPVEVLTPKELIPVFKLFKDAYRSGKTGFAAVNLFEFTSNMSSEFSATSTPKVIVSDHASFAQHLSLPNQVLIPFAGIPYGITYNLCDITSNSGCFSADLDLILSPEVLIDILSGRIRYWNDSRIISLQEPPYQSLVPNKSIILIGYNEGVRERQVFETVANKRGLSLNLNYSADIYAQNFEEASRFVIATRYSVTYGPVNRNLDKSLLRGARLKVNDQTLTALASELKACVKPEELQLLDKYSMVDPLNNGCWPFTNAYFVSVPLTFDSSSCLSQIAQETTFFADYLIETESLEGVDDPLQLIGMSYLTDNSSSLNSLSCFGRSILEPVVDPQLLPEALIWIVRVIGFGFIILVLLIFNWIRQHRNHAVLRASSPMFLFQMCFGFLFELTSVFPMTMQDQGVTPISASEQEQLDVACMATPWLYVVGFSLVYGSLLVKTWRIHKIFNNPKMRRVHISLNYLLRIEAIFFIPLLAILIFWTLFDPMVWIRVNTQLDTVDATVAVQTKGECVSRNLLTTLVPILCIFGVYIIGGLYYAWKNRHAPTEFSEGRYVSAAIMTDLELLIIVIPVMIISSSNPIASFVVKVSFVFLSVAAMILIFFYPKFALIHGFWEIESSSSNLKKELAKDIKLKQDKNHHQSSREGPPLVHQKSLEYYKSSEPSPHNQQRKSSWLSFQGSRKTDEETDGSFKAGRVAGDAIIENLKSSTSKEDLNHSSDLGGGTQAMFGFNNQIVVTTEKH